MESLEEAKQFIKDNWLEGTACPCCDQFVKLYVRKLPLSCARLMVEMYHQQKGDEYLYLPPILTKLDRITGGEHASFKGGYCTLGHFWRLLQQMPGTREDGSDRVGWWRLTEAGKMFVRGQITVPQYAKIYNQKFYGFEGNEISIKDALQNKFNYSELMGTLPL